jgi:hypothetical protein
MLMPIDDNPAGRMASGNSREKLGHSGVAARHYTLYGLNHYAPNWHDIQGRPALDEVGQVALI